MNKYQNLLGQFTTAIVLLLTTSAPSAAATNVEVWVRTAGTYGTGNVEPPKTTPRTLVLDKLPQQQGQRSDAQYGNTAFYRGVLLRDAIAQYAPPSGLDLLLLHFRNGMIIPLPFREDKAMNRLEPLIAVGISVSPQGPFSSDFPQINSQTEGFVDVPRVVFSGNKVVVKDRWHPDLPESAQGGFSPWALADSLIGIEFAESAAYYRQFVPTAEVRPGMELFRSSCQFCHGVRRVGASFGWDYAQPVELHSHRSDPARLYYHIRYRVEYKATWTQMPALKHITEEQAGVIWQWLKSVSTLPITRYTPTH
jgi:mono/diheme cytochrome c family protein